MGSPSDYTSVPKSSQSHPLQPIHINGSASTTLGLPSDSQKSPSHLIGTNTRLQLTKTYTASIYRALYAKDLQHCQTLTQIIA